MIILAGETRSKRFSTIVTSLVLLFIISITLVTVLKIDTIIVENETTGSQEDAIILLRGSETENEHENVPLQKKRSRAVVHMGPPKTGSSVIQSQTEIQVEQLLMDGYEMPWRNLIQGNESSKDDFHFKYHPFNQFNFASCFIPEKRKGPGPEDQCMSDLLLEGSNIAMRKKNLLVSSEHFVWSSDEGISMLKVYLSQWDDVSLVLYHRRIYDRIISFHNQVNKQKDGGFAKRLRDLVPMIKFIERKFKSSERTTISYLHRLEEHFDKSEIILRNFHDDGQNGKLAEKFFCDVMSDAKHTCNAIRENSEPTRSNSSHQNLDYRFLAGGALKMASSFGFGHLASLNDIRKEERLVEAVQKYHMNMHSNNTSTTPSDFPRICPSSDLLDRLWNVTLTNEMILYPEKFHDDHDHDGDKEGKGDQDTSYGQKDYKTWLREDFEKASRTLLCDLDVESVLKQEEWKRFFKDISI